MVCTMYTYDQALNLACNDAVETSKLLGDIQLDVANELTKLIKDSPCSEALLKRLKGRLE